MNVFVNVNRQFVCGQVKGTQGKTSVFATRKTYLLIIFRNTMGKVRAMVTIIETLISHALWTVASSWQSTNYVFATHLRYTRRLNQIK